MIPNLLSSIVAQAPEGEAARGYTMIIGQVVLMIVIFYFILFRPQQKQAKQLKIMLEALKPGDRVVTSGGIFGMVSQVKEKSVIVKIAENTKVEMLRSGIQQVVTEEAAREDKKA